MATRVSKVSGALALALCVELLFFVFQAEDGIRAIGVTGVQTCALPICPGGPNRAALRPSTGAPRARGRRRTSFSTDRPRRPAAPAEGSRPGRPASAAPTRPPAESRGRSRGCARAWRCARCSGASFVDLHPWYPPFLGIPRQQAVRAFGKAPVAHAQGAVEARPVVLPGDGGGQLHQQTRVLLRQTEDPGRSVLLS